jgi:S1-C subfamily serine protease
MSARNIMRVAMFLSVMPFCAVAMGQPPSQQAPRRPMTPPKADKPRRAPQVVTIVHRLNGLKMFRLLLRSQEQVQAISSLDSPFNLMDDVHTNVIAGVAMDDGETIVAWLPEAEVEFGPAPPLANESLFARPDVTVVGPGGRPLPAKYVGLDAVTGLSILKLANKNVAQAGQITKEPVETGDVVLLYGPEPVTKSRTFFNSLYVRIGAIEGRIQDVMTAPSGDVARLKVSAPKLTQTNIGGVALNEAGETIGIIDGLEGTEASIIPAALIRRAADRVLEQQASVPRPWLGVKGEAIVELKVEQMLNHGWEMNRAAALAGRHRGILLTSIAPGSPAEKAELRAGDVILKIDNKEIQNEADFTWWLDQAGPSNLVQFTVARPDRPAEEPLSVKLSGMLDPAFSFHFRTRLATTKGFSLLNQGIETIALKPAVAMQLGITAGLLVVYVDPVSAAFDAGLEPGDVIQSIDGKPPQFFKPVTLPASLKIQIVRNKEKRVLTVATKKK